MPVTLEACPSKVNTGFGFCDMQSYNLTFCVPAAARKCLSGEMARRFTCYLLAFVSGGSTESGCWMVREHIPLRASQNLIV